MSHKLSSIPKAPTGSFPPILRLLDAYFSSLDPLPQKQRCLHTMNLYLRNIFMNPGELKYRSIKLRNPKFAKDIGNCPGGDLVLLEMGFSRKVRDFEEYLVLPDDVDISVDYWRAKKYQDLMDEAIQNDKESPKNKMKADKAAREAAVQQIEEDKRNRHARDARGKISTNTLSETGNHSRSQESAARLANIAAEKRSQALTAPVQTSTVMLPTPSLTHIKDDDYLKIYEPAEDSFALLDALQNDNALIQDISDVPLVLEIGSGSGIVSAFLQQSILPTSLFICTDINELACTVTLETSRTNVTSSETILDTIRTSLTDGLRAQQFDLIVFNPPYVPTESSEIDTAGSISAAWAGGADGMDVTNQLLSRVSGLLSPRGLFYLVTVARNKPEAIIRAAHDRGIAGRSVLERRAGREKLVILRFHRKAQQQSTMGSPVTDRAANAASNDCRDRQAQIVGPGGAITSETRRIDGLRPDLSEDRTQVGILD